ncbi:MAG: T9SS type A sorting domain-containing protein [bacterium]
MNRIFVICLLLMLNGFSASFGIPNGFDPTALDTTAILMELHNLPVNFTSVAMNDGYDAYVGASGEEGFAGRYYIDSQQAVRNLEGTEWYIAYSWDGSRWAAAGRISPDSTVLVLKSTSSYTFWTFSLNNALLTGPDCLKFSADGSTLAILTNDSIPRLIVWNTQDYSIAPVMNMELPPPQYPATDSPAIGLSLSHTGQYIAAKSGGSIYVVEQEGGRFVEVATRVLIPGFALSPDGNKLVYVTTYSGALGTVYWAEWNEEYGTYHTHRSTYSSGFRHYLFSWPTDTLFISVGWDHRNDELNRIKVQVYDTESQLTRWQWPYSSEAVDTGRPVALSASRDGTWFAIGTEDQGAPDVPHIYVFNWGNRDAYFTYEMPGWCNALGISPSGTHLVAAGRNENGTSDLYVFDLKQDEIEPEMTLEDLYPENHQECIEYDRYYVELELRNSGYLPVVFDTMYYLDPGLSNAYLFAPFQRTVFQPGDEQQLLMEYDPEIIEPSEVLMQWVVYFRTLDFFPEVSTDTLEFLAVFDSCYASDADETMLPLEFELRAPYPNPFNASATIAFTLPASSQVQLSVFDVLGREQAQLINTALEAGNHELIWQPSALPSGVYLIRLETTLGTRIQKAILLK